VFSGPNDCVRCYQCGGGMKNWQPGDVPVAEHALWFPTCELINRNDVSIEDENHGACGDPGKDLNLKDFTTTENKNGTVTSDDNTNLVVSEIQTNILQKSESETADCQRKNSSEKLFRENEDLKQQLLCKICMDNDADVVFLPCGHMIACTTCARALRKCAVCRALIKSALKSLRK